jgi:hypothetical protein
MRISPRNAGQGMRACLPCTMLGSGPADRQGLQNKDCGVLAVGK